MKKNWKLSTAAVALSIFGAGMTGAQAQEAATAAAKTNDTAIQDVVITASRREEKMQDVPIAVQALGAKSLQELGITDFSKLLTYLPDVHAAGRGPGQNTVYIRGLSTDTASILIAGAAGTNPNVAIYLDDVAVSMPARNLDVYAADLERVEVLKGPQGTLFGASAMGGAVRYITAKPDLREFHAGMKMSYAQTKSGDDSVSAQGYVNIPIIADKFAIRAVVYNDNRGGYIDNIAATYQMPANSPGFKSNDGNYGSNVSRPIVDNATVAKKNFNTTNYRGVRLSAKLQINDDWSVEVQNAAQVLKTEGVFDYDPTLPDLQVKRFNPDNLQDKGNVASWTVNGRLGQLDLLYTGGYVERRSVQNTDYTGYSSSGGYAVYYNCDYGASNAGSGAVCHNPKNHVHNDTRNTRFTEEFRVSTPSDWRLRAIGGVYYDQNHVYDQDHFAYEGSVDSGFNGPNQPLSYATAINRNITDPAVQFVNDITRSDRQIAVFGEVAYDLIPEKLTLTVGARYYDQQVEIKGGASYGARDWSPSYNQAGDHGISLEATRPRTEKGIIPKVNLTYKPAPGLMVYATYSEGFRPGGFNRGGGNVNSQTGFVVPIGYNTDTVKNYELGWKTQWLDNTLQINGAAYVIDWKDIQSQIYRPRDSFLTFVQNAADARIKGVEGNVIWRGIPGLTISSAFTYTHSELTRVNEGVANLRPIGSQLALTPELQGNIMARYERDFVQGSTVYGQVGAQAAGRMLSTIDRGADFNGNPLTGDYHLKAYQTVDAAIGVNKDNWNVELYGDNLTDTRAQLYANASDRTLRITTNRPTTVGVRVAVKY
jgi:outer membrane receptor protein involved in Fe transport